MDEISASGDDTVLILYSIVLYYIMHECISGTIKVRGTFKQQRLYVNF